MAENTKALVLVDSNPNLDAVAWAYDKFDETTLLHITVGGKGKVPEAVKNAATEFELKLIHKHVSGSLLSCSVDVEGSPYASDEPQEAILLKESQEGKWQPGRNLLMVGVAINVATQNNTPNIVVEVDSQDFPDRTGLFWDVAKRAAKLSVGLPQESAKIIIHTPLMD